MALPPVQRLVLGPAVGGAAAAPAAARPEAAADPAQSGAAAEPPRGRGGRARGRLLGGRLLGVRVVPPRQLAPEHCGRDEPVSGAAALAPSLPPSVPPTPRLTAEGPARARQAVAGGAAAGEHEEGAVEGVGSAGQRRVELQQEGAGLLAAAAAQRGGARQPDLAQPRRPPPDLAGEAGAAQPPGTARALGRRRETQLHAGSHACPWAGGTERGGRCSGPARPGTGLCSAPARLRLCNAAAGMRMGKIKSVEDTGRALLPQWTPQSAVRRGEEMTDTLKTLL